MKKLVREERWDIVQVVAAPPGWKLKFKVDEAPGGVVERKLCFLGLVRRWTEVGGKRQDEWCCTGLEPLHANEWGFNPAGDVDNFLEMCGPEDAE